MLHCCFPLVPIAWRRARQSPSPDYLDQHFVCDCLARHNHEESLLIELTHRPAIDASARVFPAVSDVIGHLIWSPSEPDNLAT